MLLKVVEITQTCGGCPSQWEGRLSDGREIYIRYRWSTLSVQIVVHDGNWQLIYKDGDGTGWSGVMSTEEMIIATATVLNFDELP